MGLFEDVVINAKNAATAVGEKANQIMDISKLRINAADLNNEISKRFEALGRVDSKKTGASSDELIGECVAAIDELYEQLDAVNEQLAAKRSRIPCKKCGQENPVGAAYCSKCGQKLQPDAAEDSAEETTAAEPEKPTENSEEPKE
jgi:ribosomal protein L40E